MTYTDLQQALRVLGLGERASLKEIKARHRELVKRYHPDAGNVIDLENIRQVNVAYRTLSEYISEYRFSFAKDEFFEQNPEERILEQFADDPVWGKR
ncbi:MAG TPA: J domain-containing protein [Dongiaceae bacterium]|nr:J domain-containing protein [Dongiaceae bacterium]